MRSAILSLILAFFASNFSAKKQAQSEPQKGAPVQSDRQYFPVGTFDEKNQPSYRERWYSYYLTAMDEPSLLEAAQNRDILTYRLTLMGNRALCVRVALQRDGTGVLEGKLVTFRSGSKTLYVKDLVPISKDQVQQFLMLLQKAEFWSMKTEQERAKNGPYEMDGARWVLEGAGNGNYHVVDRWSPRGTAYEQVCNYLMELSPVKHDQDARDKKGR
ncbi:MAG TPA: hypothetical protein VGI46_02630 [Candidatus Acidoferrum sp.]|jgi:hypothetical protein